MFLVKSVLQSKTDNMQVMLFDKHPDGPYLELIQKAFANSKPVLRHQHYKKQKVIYCSSVNIANKNDNIRLCFEGLSFIWKVQQD